MNQPPNRLPPRFPGASPEPAPEDPSIPLLTERLGLPPLEFDTTLPLIETTGQMIEPMLEGLTALPDAPQPQSPPPAPSTAGLHPIAALPFPPIAYPEESAPLPAPAAAARPIAAPPAPPPPAPVPAAPPVLPVPPLPPIAARPAPASTPLPPLPTLPPAPVTLPTAHAAMAPAAAPAATATAATPGQHWGRIEVELRSSILRQITEQLPREIDGIVQGRMQAAIDRLLASLAEEIHLAVTASLADIVERAVRAELERMRNSNRG